MKWHVGLILSVFFCVTAASSQLAPELEDKIREVLADIYHVSAGELQDIVGQWFPEIPICSAEELASMMEAKPDLVVMNVLPENLYNDCHIVGSISVPLKNLVDSVAGWDRDTEIVVYCALDVCDAGQKAYVLLTLMGFTNVIDYENGIKEWFQLGYPTAGPAQSSYLHARTSKLPVEPEYVVGCSIFDIRTALRHTDVVKKLRDIIG